MNDCSRRVVLQTIGAGCLAAACGGGGGPPEGVATMCGSDLCVSIAENPELAEVGGGLVFKAGSKQIYVVRTASGFSSVSAICTHAGCVIEWAGTRFECPCHGSVFAADGIVQNGPASRPLQIYANMLVGDTLTITL
jgi:Rieske Fe-S protein